jgi:hypothetical protein
VARTSRVDHRTPTFNPALHLWWLRFDTISQPPKVQSGALGAGT